MVEEEAPERKLRPITQAEATIKLVESAVIDDELVALRSTLEPKQLGVATPDGCVRAVKLLRGWVEAMELAALGESGSGDPGEWACLAKLDMENAYGRFYRADALEAAEKRVGRLAQLAAVQWRTGELRVWLNTEHGQ